jgi:hypothetical protein
MGGRIESVTSEMTHDSWAAVHLIDHRTPPGTAWESRAHDPFPQEVVLSFFDRQPAWIGAVVLNPHTQEYPEHWAKDVEIWTSLESATAGFVKTASLALRPEPVEQTVTFPPVEARFVKVRVVSAQAPDAYYVSLGKVRVLEASKPGYVPLLARSPELAATMAATAAREAAPTAVSPPAVSPGMLSTETGGVCAGSAAPTGPTPTPSHAESHNVLVIAKEERSYPPATYGDRLGRWPVPLDQPEFAVYKRLVFTRVMPEAATPLLLRPALGVDTIVFAQVCDIKESVTSAFKQALMPWVAEGHKLIIQDSDECGKGPDYGFLPYPFATSNPGAQGAKSDRLLFVEENTIGNSRPGDPSFVDVGAWTSADNELGDSNTITKYDAHWCGHLFGTNVLRVNGFEEAYAHHGRGLIIYDGFDVDQASAASYRRLVTRELAQPFDPDGLPCNSRLGDFVITTDEALKHQLMVPGRSYTFPLTLLSNQGFTGTIALAATTVSADPTVAFTFASPSVELSETATTALTVTTTAASPPTTHILAIRGTASSGRSNTLCLPLEERRTGALRIVTDGLRAKKPTRNLEIVLDLSGSMKLPLGKSTRIATARQVLRDVLTKLPDDFNVGLRVYGHRFSSLQKETCTDSELVVPIQKLDRQRLNAIVDAKKPRGETPLVYSILQTPADLQAAGGGSVILITDGEESCKGDPQQAVRQIKAAGVDIDLNIVGFTLSGARARLPLAAMAEAMGGRYYEARNGEELARALLIAAVDKVPFSVFDSNGREVVTGTAGTPQELAPGDYKVVIHAGDQELVAERVTIEARGDTTIRVTLTGDRFHLER